MWVLCLATKDSIAGGMYMAGLVALFLFMSIVVVCTERHTKEDKKTTKKTTKTIRCPTCGSPASIHGNMWECGYCLDSGYITTRRRYVERGK